MSVYVITEQDLGTAGGNIQIASPSGSNSIQVTRIHVRDDVGAPFNFRTDSASGTIIAASFHELDMMDIPDIITNPGEDLYFVVPIAAGARIFSGIVVYEEISA